MLIEIISDSTIKITLSKADMDEYNISYDMLDRKNPETREFLTELLDVVEEEKKLELYAEKLFVEAFPQTDGGCLLYISLVNNTLKEKSNPYSELTCVIESVHSLIQLCKELFRRYSYLIHKSELYEDLCGFRLIISTFSRSEDKICRIISEYGHILGKSNIISESTREHYKSIIENNAIDRLSELPS